MIQLGISRKRKRSFNRLLKRVLSASLEAFIWVGKADRLQGARNREPTPKGWDGAVPFTRRSPEE